MTDDFFTPSLPWAALGRPFEARKLVRAGGADGAGILREGGVDSSEPGAGLGERTEDWPWSSVRDYGAEN